MQNTAIGAHGQIGTLLSEYTVSEYWDLRTSAGGAAPTRAYLVTLSQRLTLANYGAAGIMGPQPFREFGPYPVLAVNAVEPAVSDALTYYVEDYSPKTLNSSLTTSVNQGTTTEAGSSRGYTSGSSYSDTSSYEVNASLNIGELLSGSVGASASSSHTRTTEESTSTGATASRGAQSGTASSMSIKDWGSYAYLDAAKQQISWAWGQEYPWNVVDYRSSADGTGVIDLPPYVQTLMWDTHYLYPPSQISQFGLNFAAHASWVFLPGPGATEEDETVGFSHLIAAWSAEHSVEAGALVVRMQPLAEQHRLETVSLELPVLSLLPLAEGGAGNGAVVGFVPSEFLGTPAAGARQRLKSHANNLYVTCDGFGPPAPDGVFTAAGLGPGGSATLTVRFKVADPDVELALHLKHWKTGQADCALTITVNGTPIQRHVDTRNAEGGADNLTTVALRDRDYTGADFYDYLVMGVNVITVAVAPDGPGDCGYAIRALAVQ